MNDVVKSLTSLLSSPRLLPNESEAEFQSSLQGLLSELDNPSPLNVALVTQLNECLWWIKRHTVDKELLLHESMARILAKGDSYTEIYDYHLVSMALDDYLAGNASEKDKEWVAGIVMILRRKFAEAEMKEEKKKTKISLCSRIKLQGYNPEICK